MSANPVSSLVSTLFAVVLFSQLQWAKRSYSFDDLLLRVILSAVLAVGLPLIIGLILGLFKIRVAKDRTIGMIARLIAPLQLCYLYLIPFYSAPDKDVLGGKIVAGVALLAAMGNALLVRGSKANSSGWNVESVLLSEEILAKYRVWLRSCQTILRKTSRMTTLRGVVRLYPLTLVVITLQSLAIVKYSPFVADSFLHFLWYFVATVVPAIFIIDLVKSLSFGKRALSGVLSSIVLALYALLLFFHISESYPLQFSLLRINADLLFYSESIRLLFVRANKGALIILIAGIFGALYLERRYRFLTDLPHTTKPLQPVVCLLGFGLVMQAIPSSADETVMFARSVIDYLEQKKAYRSLGETLEVPFPYAQESFTPSEGIPRRDWPHVFVIVMESLNGELIGATGPRGAAITPIYNDLTEQGLYVEHFYGNSVQSCRGLFAVLSGAYPSYREKVFTHFDDLNVRGLPEILSENGYETAFIKAYHDLSFDNTGPYVKKLGFDTVFSITDDFLTKEEQEQKWGWGIQDDLFYSKCFEHLDRRSSQGEDGPFFTMMFTVSNHMMFNKVPDEQKYLYPNAGNTDFRENFLNSSHLADRYLQRFFDELERRGQFENSIVIVTGDHSFPQGTFSQKNEKGFREENFRTPIVILWNGVIAPRRIVQEARSQIDIAPTVLDLLGMSSSHHFVGTSLLRPSTDPVLLSQPYDGLYLVAVRYPYKYVQRTLGNVNCLYNLSADPREEHNILHTADHARFGEELGLELNRLKINQFLLEQNRIYPSDALSFHHD